MALYAFSTLSDGQAISFDPNADVLNFDQATISAADLGVTVDGTNLRIGTADKSVVLQSVSPLQLATSNVTFANGSALLFGDNSPGTANDDAANALNGTSGNDLLQGFGGADTLNGGNGNDTYIVGSGDVVNDTGGTDTILTDISFNPPAGIENVTMTGTGNIEIDGNTLANLITGNAGNNVAWANNGDDTVIGGAGNDDLHGEAGNDWMEGGLGNDTVGGGGDKDHIAFREYGAANADHVISFASNWDDIQLDIAAFTALGANGRFASGDARFYSAAGANAGHDADDRIVYNTSTGQLWYDADGNGAGAAQLIATLDGAPTLVATDINVFGTPAPTGNTINGTSGDDTLNGTTGDDTINGFDGNDYLNGLEGNDSLVGGGGNDALYAGYGADTLIGGDGNDTLVAHDEPVQGDNSPKVLDGGLGNDTYIVEYPSDTILPDPGGYDTVILDREGSWTLGSGLDKLQFDADTGGYGVGNELDNVLLSGLGGGGELWGMGGNDFLQSRGFDSGTAMYGGDGNDTLQGVSDRGDRLNGGAGNDVLIG